MRKTNFPNHHFRLATRGRSIQKGQQETSPLHGQGASIALSRAAYGTRRRLASSRAAILPSAGEQSENEIDSVPKRHASKVSRRGLPNSDFHFLCETTMSRQSEIER